MSRIDDALKRLAGVVSSEPRTSAGLDRYASEGAPRTTEEPKRPARVDAGHGVAKFATPGPRPVDPRPAVSHPAPAAPVATSAPEPRPEVHADAESEPLVDVRQLLNYGAFIGRSVRRHKLLAAATVALVIGGTVGLALLLPKTYFVQTKLFAQRNAVMAALSNPGRAVPWDADAPTRAAAETVLRRDNLISLITQTDLIKEWDRRRAPVLKLKDWVIATGSRYEMTPDDKLEMMVGLL